MSNDVLQQVTELITARPHDATSLSLYALVSTLRMDKGGYMYLLRKLRDLAPEHRRLAYGLMELMAEHGNQGADWETALQAMDEALRRG